ncbi:NPCBM/NEW2 domain-containing protein [Aureliella helgolandensis]|uniref:NPCBM/NEW2 domain protein n=1 Tax=Aureliella helgolandensis TaxID=2527968 RepID=A0A518G237_9BACT|nr:NPCBM/NEW2 domain-containing protein [Aureliella helgolandensis]QDV22687.1 NPCBM/NEW2 domain protein [Aureliella helgolandensis]
MESIHQTYTTSPSSILPRFTSPRTAAPTPRSLTATVGRDRDSIASETEQRAASRTNHAHAPTATRGTRYCVAGFVGLLIHLATGLSVTAQTLHTANTIYSQASLRSIELDGSWRFDVSGDVVPTPPVAAEASDTAPSPAIDKTQTTLPLEQIVRWGGWRGPRRTQAAWLQGGSWLCGEILPRAGGVDIQSDWLETPRIPWPNLRGLLLNPPALQSQCIQLQSEMQAAEGELDQVWLSDGRQVAGVIAFARPDDANDALPLRTLKMERAGQNLEFDWNSIQAIVFSPALAGSYSEFSNASKLGLRDGSLLGVRSLKATAAGVHLELLSGISVRSLDPLAEFPQVVEYISAVPPQTIFLADLPPDSFRHLEENALQWPLGRNRDMWGRPLLVRLNSSLPSTERTDTGARSSIPPGERVATQQEAAVRPTIWSETVQVERGLAMHGSSQAAYRWDGKPGTFLAEVRLAAPLPQAKRLTGEVRCKVIVARAGKLSPIVDRQLPSDPAPPLGQEDALRIACDVTGAQLIVLVVESGADGGYGDQALWLDARVVAEKPERN